MAERDSGTRVALDSLGALVALDSLGALNEKLAQPACIERFTTRFAHEAAVHVKTASADDAIDARYRPPSAARRPWRPRYEAVLRSRMRWRYDSTMTNSARRLLEDALALSENERLDLASKLLASVDGPKDEDWDSAWLTELDRRAAAIAANGDGLSGWSDVRSRLVDRIGRR